MPRIKKPPVGLIPPETGSEFIDRMSRNRPGNVRPEPRAIKPKVPQTMDDMIFNERKFGVPHGRRRS